MGHMPQNTGALEFGFYFPAKEIQQNFHSLFGRQDLCDHGSQSDEGAPDDLHLIAFRDLIIQLLNLRGTCVIS
jgi:hypothetical protein